jgi:hypothetical protein
MFEYVTNHPIWTLIYVTSLCFMVGDVVVRDVFRYWNRPRVLIHERPLHAVFYFYGIVLLAYYLGRYLTSG